MRRAIMDEAKLHPMAQPQDYIKLIFQSEFGPGHLIADAGFAAKRLWDEWQQVKTMAPEPDQDIGGGYTRLCIKGIGSDRLENINAVFVRSANEKSGTEEGFLKKLELFLQMAEEGCFLFDAHRAHTAVKEYLAEGIRPTSHKKTYHDYYKPAYRVVRK